MPDGGSFDPIAIMRQAGAGKFTLGSDEPIQPPTAATSAPAVHITVRPQPSQEVAPEAFDPVAIMKQASRGKFDYAPAAPVAEPKKSGLLNNFIAGASSGIQGVAGAIMNAPNHSQDPDAPPGYAIPDHAPVHVPGLMETIPGAAEWANRHPITDPVLNPDRIEPQGMLQQGARTAGEILPSMFLPGLGPAGLVAKGMQTVGIAAGQTLGEHAGDVYPGMPDWMKTYFAPLAGGVAGGVGAHFIQAGIGTAARGIGSVFGGAGIGPKTTIGGQRVTGTQADNAARQISEALGPEGRTQLVNSGAAQSRYDELAARMQSGISTPADVAEMAALRTGPNNQYGAQMERPIDGSQPTLAQLVPNPETVGLEQAHRTANDKPFIGRAVEQNNARLSTIQAEGGGEGANAGAVSPRLQAVRGQIDAQGQAATEGAQMALSGARTALGEPVPVQQAGAAMRSALETAYDAGHPAITRLWDAVDPEGKLALSVSPVKKAADDLLKSVNPAVGDALSEPESRIIGGARRLPDVISFRDLGKLRNNIGTAERALRATPGNDQSLRRLGILKSAVDDSIAQAAEGVSADEIHAVSAGNMTPEQTMLSRLETWANNERAKSEAAAGVGAGNGGGQVSGQISGSGTAEAVGDGGAAGAARGGAGHPEGSEGVPGQTERLTPNFGPDNAADYAAARNATLREKQTFRQGPVGDVLQPGKAGAEFRVADSAVPAKFFNGPSSAENVAKYINASGGTEDAIDAAQKFLVSDLHERGIISREGTIDVGKFEGWQRSRANAIATLDKATSSPLAPRFKSIVEAQNTYDEVTAAHKAALAEFDKGAARRFIGADPMKAVASALGQGSNPTKTFDDLVQMVRPDPAAMNGLKKAVTDYITEKLTGSVPSGDANDMLKAATFRTWMDTNKKPLRVLFGGQGMQNLEMVAADLRRQATATQAVTGSATASRAINTKAHGLAGGTHTQTALVLIAEHVGEMIAHGLGQTGIIGGAIGVGATITPMLAHSLKQAGIKTTNDLVGQALLHPSVARELMTRVRPDGTIGPVAQRRIAAALQAVTTSQAERSTTERRQ
jgi:hypothetical protein